MPWWASAVAVFIASIARSLVARIMSALGLGTISFLGISTTVDNVVASIKGSIGFVPSNILTFMSLFGFDRYLSLVASAFVAVILLKIGAGFFKRFGFVDTDGGN